MPDRVAIVTGGGSGIGRAIATTLAGEGFHLVLTGRTEPKLRETADAIGTASGTTPMVLTGDVSDPAFAPHAVGEVVAALGRIDALINNAGVAPLAPIPETNDDVLERTIAVNTLGPARLIREAWPHLAAADGPRGGCVVNVSSVAAADPFPGFFAYAASKAAVESMVRSIANEGAKDGIRAYAVAPGAVETPMLRGAFPDFPASQTLAPQAIADVVVSCVMERDAPKSGSTVTVPSP